MANQTYQIQVEGMGCPSCIAKIENSLSTLEGVSSKVDFPAKSVAVELDVNKSNVQDVVRKIEGLGYQAVISSDIA